MASVASLVRGSDGYMKFIDYQSTYKDNNKEFLRGDMWELQFINVPKIIIVLVKLCKLLEDQVKINQQK